eukprot:scaffold8157_cov20-Tisochrysis_lutea.AAC.1
MSLRVRDGTELNAVLLPKRRSAGQESLQVGYNLCPCPYSKSLFCMQVPVSPDAEGSPFPGSYVAGAAIGCSTLLIDWQRNRTTFQTSLESGCIMQLEQGTEPWNVHLCSNASPFNSHYAHCGRGCRVMRVHRHGKKTLLTATSPRDKGSSGTVAASMSSGGR